MAAARAVVAVAVTAVAVAVAVVVATAALAAAAEAAVVAVVAAAVVAVAEVMAADRERPTALKPLAISCFRRAHCRHPAHKKARMLRAFFMGQVV